MVVYYIPYTQGSARDKFGSIQGVVLILILDFCMVCIFKLLPQLKAGKSEPNFLPNRPVGWVLFTGLSRCAKKSTAGHHDAASKQEMVHKRM